jgi:hypothetical protein
MTLVFAKEAYCCFGARSAGSRYGPWHGQAKYIAGKEEHVKIYLTPVLKWVLHFISKKGTSSNGTETITNYYEISNNSDLYFDMELKSGEGTGKVTLFPQSSQIISAPAGQEKLTYEVVTAFIRSDKHLVVEIPLK